MDFNLLHPAQQIVMIMERIYKYGMTTTSGGNLSILDEEGNIWISPAGVDKGSLTYKDVVCVKPDGSVDGIHRPSSEFPFHQLVYKNRPDLKAVLHAHPPGLVAFSIVRKIPEIHLIPNIKLVCGGVGLAEYGLPGSTTLGENIAKVFKEGINTVILENHGVVVGANDLFQAFMAFETLEFCARLEMDAYKIDSPVLLTNEAVEISKNKNHAELEDFECKSYSPKEREARDYMCQLIHRAYDQQLFTSSQGTFSQKLDDGSFIITPYDKDRKYIEPRDIVRIEDDKKESGKIPSRSIRLHQEIYKQHPHVNSVIIAHPPSIMAFAITNAEFDSRTIPESYILLRDIPKLPFGSTFMDPQGTAAKFNKATPIIMVKNDCVVVTGSNLLNAFDRLEVLEYSARAVVASKSLGPIVNIGEKEIKDIEVAFKLD